MVIVDTMHGMGLWQGVRSGGRISAGGDVSWRHHYKGRPLADTTLTK